MMPPDIPANERERLLELERYRILGTTPEQAYDDLARIAAAICATPVALVSLVDRDRQWFKARLGVEAEETPRDVSFCAHAIDAPGEVFVVPDALADPRFADNPLVTGEPYVRFYAGAPLVSPSGFALGSLCVIDRVPRTLGPAQIEALEGLARQAVAQMELRRAYRELRHQLEERAWYESQLDRYRQELEQEIFRLTRQSSTDPLTGLANRRGFSEALDWRLERAREGESLHLAIIDIDHFKAINDRHGHPAGDEVLAGVARVLKSHCAGRGTVARAGGEEFAVLLPGMSRETAVRECESLRAEVERAPAAVRVTVSVGLASHRAGDAAADLYRRADGALYEAKAAGRNRVAAAPE